MDRILFDIRLALRRMRQHSVHTATVILCLALGVGANTAIFSVVNSLLFKPLPGIDVDRLLFVHQLREGFDPYEGAYLDYAAVRSAPETFAAAGLSQRRSVNLTEGDEPERIEGARVTWDYLAALGIQPLHGRLFGADQDRPGGAPVLLLGYDLWQRRFAGDPAVVGSTLRIEDSVYTVLGVMPRGFDMPLGTELWLPMATDFEAFPLRERASQDFLMVARMADGVGLAAARSRIAALNAQLLETYPEVRRGWETRAIPLRRQLLHDINGELEPRMAILLGVVGLLLLVTCANVASLLLVRSLGRGRELALKTALGATRQRLMTEVLTESLVLSLAGGAAGLLLALVVGPPLMALSPVDAFAYGEVFRTLRLDGSVLGFTLGVSLLTGVLFGLAPALRAAAKRSLVSELQAGGRGGGSAGERRLLGALVVAEIAIAVALLLGAAVMGRSFQQLQRTDLGFEPDRRLVVEMFLSAADYPEHAQRVAFATELLDRVRALPAVRAAGTTTTIPLHHDAWDAAYRVEGRPPEDPDKVPTGTFRVVSPGFLETAGIELVEGRLLTDEDRAGTLPVVVITREFARQAFPDRPALGGRLKLASRPPDETPWWTVVGVVEDVKEDPFNFYVDRPAWYFPYAQLETALPLNLVLHTDGDPRALVGPVRDAIRDLAPRQPISEIVTLKDHVAVFLGPNRFGALLVSLFALVGLVLSAVGLYGLMSFSVARRIKEIGIRMAMGAGAGKLRLMVLRRGLLLTGAGLLAGLALGSLLTRVLARFLYQVDAAGPGAFLATAAVLLTAALGALYLPARRATRVDPIQALRDE